MTAPHINRTTCSGHFLWKKCELKFVWKFKAYLLIQFHCTHFQNIQFHSCIPRAGHRCRTHTSSRVYTQNSCPPSNLVYRCRYQAWCSIPTNDFIEIRIINKNLSIMTRLESNIESKLSNNTFIYHHLKIKSIQNIWTSLFWVSVLGCIQTSGTIVLFDRT